MIMGRATVYRRPSADKAGWLVQLTERGAIQ